MKQKSDVKRNDDQTLLKHCETTIARGHKHALAVGEAMNTIREGRLYRLTGYKTFEQYCRERWGFTRQHASRLIDTFKLNQELVPDGDKIAIESEGLRRRFRQLLPEQQKHITKRVIDDEANAREEIAKAEREPCPRLPDEIKQAKKLANALRTLLWKSKDKSRMIDAIQGLLTFIADFKRLEKEQKQISLAE